jgi:hypothetical protein
MGEVYRAKDTRLDRTVADTLHLPFPSGKLVITTAPSDYHEQAKEQLRKYVRLLGTSLAAKNSEVLDKSLKTYQMLAEERSCKGDPLILDAERAAVLSEVKSRIVPRPQNETGPPNP